MAVNEAVLEKTIKRCRERGIVVPTFAQMKNPQTAPAAVKTKLANALKVDPEQQVQSRTLAWQKFAGHQVRMPHVRHRPLLHQTDGRGPPRVQTLSAESS